MFASARFLEATIYTEFTEFPGPLVQILDQDLNLQEGWSVATTSQRCVFLPLFLPIFYSAHCQGSYFYSLLESGGREANLVVVGKSFGVPTQCRARFLRFHNFHML